MQHKAAINNNFKEYLVFKFSQIKYIAIKEDSPKNKGLPMVLHCINVGTVRNVKIKILFFSLVDKNNIRIGKFIIWRAWLARWYFLE